MGKPYRSRTDRARHCRLLKTRRRLNRLSRRSLFLHPYQQEIMGLFSDIQLSAMTNGVPIITGRQQRPSLFGKSKIGKLILGESLNDPSKGARAYR